MTLLQVDDVYAKYKSVIYGLRCKHNIVTEFRDYGLAALRLFIDPKGQ